MPYMLVSANSQFCLHKQNADKTAGALVPGGCHPTKAKAEAHMRALYAAETQAGKELTEAQEELITKELETKQDYVSPMQSWVPSGVTTFADLDAWRQAQEATQEIRTTADDLQSLINNVIWNPDIADKSKAIKSLADEFGALIKQEETDITAQDLQQTGSQKELEEKGTAEDNNLPDSAFLYVEPGKKDSEGKTEPRSNRHLPVRKADGSLDLPRLRNALSRLGQSATGNVAGESWLTAGVRSSLQARAKKLLANANKSFGDKFKDLISSVMGWEVKETKPDPEGMMFWKESDGTWLWFARYSNMFRDRDNPPEIISSQSHKSFVDKVDKGLIPYPELWLWHRPEYRWGKSFWVAYDDAGFALAMGKVDKGFEPLAETMSKLDPSLIRVSHGMPIKSIVRDPDDPTVIIEHETAEISPLPSKAAANVLTSFYVLSNKEDSNTMAIPAEKKKILVEEWGLPESVLDALEKQNAAQAKEATQSGIQSKEAAPAATPAVETTPAPTPAPVPPATPATAIKEEPAQPPAQANSPSVQEIADAVSNVLNERLTAIDQKFTALDAQITAIQAEVKSLKETDETKITKAAAQTPIASLSALLARSVQSAIGSPETKVDGRTELGKSKPKEAEAQPENYANPAVMTIEGILREYDQKAKTAQ